ncbi:hypothetical protein HanIR_Chr16g0798871 [Helianthus annuus]|nr:hypothetical protein HanIR_Chr16g0798871 [Helianthus annuus]
MPWPINRDFRREKLERESASSGDSRCVYFQIYKQNHVISTVLCFGLVRARIPYVARSFRNRFGVKSGTYKWYQSRCSVAKIKLTDSYKF